MPKITATISSREVDKLVTAARGMGDRMSREMQALIEKYVDLLYDEAYRTCPVRTGELQKSHKKEIGDLLGAVVVERFYGRFVHFGRKGVRPNPWLANAWEKYRKAFIKEAKRIVSP